jgi:RNA polymerase sigma-70 factor (ECF subfamily)
MLGKRIDCKDLHTSVAMLTAARSSLNLPTQGIDASFAAGVDAEVVNIRCPRAGRAHGKMAARIQTRMVTAGNRAFESEATEADAAMDLYARDGDPRALARVIDLIQPRLFGYIRRQLHGDANAEDLVQVCFLKLHQHRGRFCPGAAVLPYAFAIARRLLIDKARSDRRERGREATLSNQPPPRSQGPEDLLARRRALARIEAALCEIPEHHREAFELTAMDGLSLEAAAAITDTTPTTLKMRKHYALAALRERLGDELEELLR